MTTIDRALALLEHFSETRPAIGLTQLAALSEYDKATTRRMLMALTRCGYIEQDRATKEYRLGAALVRLARVREATFPIQSIIEPMLRKIVEATGETAHFSLACGASLATLGLVESSRAHCVRLEKGEALPLHATASGIAFLAFAAPGNGLPPRASLRAFTPKTVTDVAKLGTKIAAARRNGWASSVDGYEDGVFGLAAPVFGADGYAMGAVAIAAPSSRVTTRLEPRLRAVITDAAKEISQALGGSSEAAA
ncbi:IclR family transcriptional regulator [Steroidobacter sp.]|uniref:IclR family transcriptional regulator n=1 Tax=Steroidobacter sp. TaxID=1978227 RepID=UPI001A47C725|nr:IclR family transcriptional regulator [Steroidobacter sp.]MBL8266668.1 IclR family transcriptional regulator [Steroidobacter sp.]